jgi:hypothetical protein
MNMRLLLIQGNYLAVYKDRKQVAIYEVDWSLEPEPLQLIKELME